MPRLGELLIAAGLLTVEQVEQALRAQVLWGGRLGTNLVELHYLELDPLSKVLGHQHGMPAALARHFEKADPDLQRMLSPDFAERFSCVPLLRMGPERHVVVASIAPLLPKQLAVIADELAVDLGQLVPAIAPELRIRYQLERVYNIRRAARFLRARGKSIPPFPAFEALPIQPEPEPEPERPWLPTSTREMALFRPEGLEPSPPAPEPAPIEPTPIEPEPTPIEPEGIAVGQRATGDLDDLTRHATLEDDLEIPIEPAQRTEPAEPAAPASPIEGEATGRERRQYVRTIADAPSPEAEAESERQALLGRIAIRKVAVGAAPRVMSGATLGEATRAIRRATGRDRVAELVIDTLERFAPACESAIMLVVRGATAIGWKGFQRTGGVISEIAVPLEDGGLVPRAVELNVTLRKRCAELDAIDRLLLGSLGRRDGDLVVVPISIADQVMCVIAIATVNDAPLASAEPIAAAAGAAFARLMRDASR